MRYCLFGEGEGVHSDSEHPLWATVLEGLVTDATVEARKRGIYPGVSESSARSLVTDLHVFPKDPLPTQVMHRAWACLWAHSPWIRTLDEHAFWIQLPGEKPPYQEVKGLLQELEQSLGEHRRVRLGMAETPFLSRVLVAWSRMEKVPGATYRRIGQQQWIVSPGMGSGRGTVPTDWLKGMPIRALWMLPPSIKDRLNQLGIHRLNDFTWVPDKEMERHFGKASKPWRHWLSPALDERLEVNYPPLNLHQGWQAPLGESVPIQAGLQLISPLIESLCADLQKRGMGACKIELDWTTDAHSSQVERVFKHPMFRTESLLPFIERMYAGCRGRSLERVGVRLQDLRLLIGAQMSFVIHGDQLLPTAFSAKDDLKRLLSQVNRKYPRTLWVGAQPRFRELRMDAFEAFR